MVARRGDWLPDWLVNGGTRLGRETSERKCSRVRECTGVSYFLENKRLLGVEGLDSLRCTGSC
jgi:hypothetical protein